jgi:hypothetical protein
MTRWTEKSPILRMARLIKGTHPHPENSQIRGTNPQPENGQARGTNH